MTKPQGLSSSQLELIEGIFRTALKAKKNYTVSIFGSRVRGDHHQYSDLDLWIESEPTLTRDEEGEKRCLFNLKNCFQKKITDHFNPDSDKVSKISKVWPILSNQNLKVE